MQTPTFHEIPGTSLPRPAIDRPPTCWRSLPAKQFCAPTYRPQNARSKTSPELFVGKRVPTISIAAMKRQIWPHLSLPPDAMCKLSTKVRMKINDFPKRLIAWRPNRPTNRLHQYAADETPKVPVLYTQTTLEDKDLAGLNSPICCPHFDSPMSLGNICIDCKNHMFACFTRRPHFNGGKLPGPRIFQTIHHLNLVVQPDSMRTIMDYPLATVRLVQDALGRYAQLLPWKPTNSFLFGQRLHRTLQLLLLEVILQDLFGLGFAAPEIVVHTQGPICFVVVRVLNSWTENLWCWPQRGANDPNERCLLLPPWLSIMSVSGSPINLTAPRQKGKKGYHSGTSLALAGSGKSLNHSSLSSSKSEGAKGDSWNFPKANFIVAFPRSPSFFLQKLSTIWESLSQNLRCCSVLPDCRMLGCHLPGLQSPRPSQNCSDLPANCAKRGGPWQPHFTCTWGWPCNCSEKHLCNWLNFFFARVWPIQLEGSVKEKTLICTGRGGKSKTRNRRRRVEMHFPRPEVRIYSRKQKPTTKQKSKKRSGGPNTNKHTTIATGQAVAFPPQKLILRPPSWCKQFKHN